MTVTTYTNIHKTYTFKYLTIVNQIIHHRIIYRWDSYIRQVVLCCIFASCKPSINTLTQILPHIIVDGRVVDVLHHPPSTLVIPPGTTFVIYIDKIMFNISSLKIFGIQGWLFHNITSHRLDLHFVNNYNSSPFLSEISWSKRRRFTILWGL